MKRRLTRDSLEEEPLSKRINNLNLGSANFSNLQSSSFSSQSYPNEANFSQNCMNNSRLNNFQNEPNIPNYTNYHNGQNFLNCGVSNSQVCPNYSLNSGSSNQQGLPSSHNENHECEFKNRLTDQSHAHNGSLFTSTSHNQSNPSTSRQNSQDLWGNKTSSTSHLNSTGFPSQNLLYGTENNNINQSNHLFSQNLTSSRNPAELERMILNRELPESLSDIYPDSNPTDNSHYFAFNRVLHLLHLNRLKRNGKI